MEDLAAAAIESVLGRLRAAAGRAWVEPERVRLTLHAKSWPARGWPPAVTAVVEWTVGGVEFRAEVVTSRLGDKPVSAERIVTRRQ